jgi:hypothetical protein
MALEIWRLSHNQNILPHTDTYGHYATLVFITAVLSVTLYSHVNYAFSDYSVVEAELQQGTDILTLPKYDSMLSAFVT